MSCKTFEWRCIIYIMENKTIFNEDVRQGRIILMLLCIILPLAPFIIIYLIASKDPSDIVNACVNKKHIEKKAYTAAYGSSVGAIYYVTVGMTKLMVSRDIYNKLTVGDFISASYRKNTLIYYTKP